MLRDNKHKIVRLLEIESIINTPFIVIIPFIIIDLMKSVNINLIFTKFIEQIAPFLQLIVSGIGAGVLVGIIIFKFMRKAYSEVISPLSIITATLLTYILAENLGGNGVIAVTVLGLFFGNIYVKEKLQLQEFSSIFANSLEILVFILIGMIINIPLNVWFFINSLILFILYLGIRFIAIDFTFHKSNISLKEKVFMTLNVQKGIAVAVIAFTLSIMYADTNNLLSSIQGVPDILNLILIFMLYSIILSTVLSKFLDYFLGRVPRRNEIIIESKK
jgi:NhaP-type Na+/H+ or K+/H+ antiporter